MESQDSQILAFQCGREFLTCNTEFNACHDKSIRSFLTPPVCLLMMGSECVWGLGEGSNFQLVRGPQKLSFRAFSSRRSSLTQIFVESCVDFEVAHLSVLVVWRLPYPEIPSLIVSDSHMKSRRELVTFA